MKVLVLSDRDYELAKRKVAQELHCAQMDVSLMQAWERMNRGKWFARVELRKRRLEAHRLQRMLLS